VSILFGGMSAPESMMIFRPSSSSWWQVGATFVLLMGPATGVVVAQEAAEEKHRGAAEEKHRSPSKHGGIGSYLLWGVGGGGVGLLLATAVVVAASITVRRKATSPTPRSVEEASMGAGDTIRFTCRHCEKRLRVNADLVGKRIRCPNGDCAGQIKVPRPRHRPEESEDGDGSESRAIGGWLLLPAAGIILSPVVVALSWWRCWRLVQDLHNRGFFDQPEAAGHFRLVTLEVAGMAFLLVFLAAVAYFFFNRHRWAPLLFIAYALLSLLFTGVRFVTMLVSLKTTDVDSKYELYAFHRGSIPEMVLASGLLTTGLACMIWVPYFLLSKRVKETFV